MFCFCHSIYKWVYNDIEWSTFYNNSLFVSAWHLYFVLVFFCSMGHTQIDLTLIFFSNFFSFEKYFLFACQYLSQLFYCQHACFSSIVFTREGSISSFLILQYYESDTLVTKGKYTRFKNKNKFLITLVKYIDWWNTIHKLKQILKPFFSCDNQLYKNTRLSICLSVS